MNRTTGLLGVAFAAASLVAARPASACGGCFVPPTENTVVTGHRMAMSISPVQSVLWDQIQYSGAPEEFSWVLPVKPGAKVELANDAWFEALDAATNSVVQGPLSSCNSFGSFDNGPLFGCGAQAEAAFPTSDRSGGDVPPPVTIVHEGTVGPYETVTLSAEDPNALQKWLDDHGYKLPDDVKPTVTAYVKEGFDFIAMRLIPGVDVNAMRPVRVITPGAVLGLPLRMVAAGTGAETAIKLFVIGEGRYQTKNFANVLIDRDKLLWDFDTNSSNFSSVRQSTLAQNDGKSFLTSYARDASLLDESFDDVGPVSYTIQTPDFSYSRTASSIAAAYYFQGDANGEKVGNVNECVTRASLAGSANQKVVDTCDADGNCSAAGSDEVAASDLVCGELDDLAVALNGLHTRDVWVTRLEANLPRAALGSDLMLEAADAQEVVAHRLVVAKSVNDPCGPSGAAMVAPTRRGPNLPGGLVGLGLGLASLAWLARRRTQPARA
ncbi:MAG: DUF2330 domain-containing protein [Deltaproteobacteria bacterium]|nr:DUF2330 domain-containing protein [Deltaproteobacteria bacterium]